MNQGADFEPISEDLTAGGRVGNVAYGTLTTISESPFQFGLIYTGSDDGLVQVTKNGGGNWTNVSGTFPKELWISRVIASSHKKERVYASLNGYRWDDFNPYVYVSENYGQTWKSISSNLPTSSINVIKEDPANENVLYLGSDNGVYVSMDRGASWNAFSEGLTSAAVHDVVIQERDKDLVVGTHGRSIYVADISLIQEITPSSMNNVILAPIEPVYHSKRWGTAFSQWSDIYDPSVELQYYSPQDGSAIVTISSEDGKELSRLEHASLKGVNVMSYNLSFSKKNKKVLGEKGEGIKEMLNGNHYLPKGKYSVSISIGGKSAKEWLEIK